MPDGRLSLPAELRRRHGLAQGGEVIVEDTGDAIVLRTVNQPGASITRASVNASSAIGPTKRRLRMPGSRRSIW